MRYFVEIIWPWIVAIFFCVLFAAAVIGWFIPSYGEECGAGRYTWSC